MTDISGLSVFRGALNACSLGIFVEQYPVYRFFEAPLMHVR